MSFFWNIIIDIAAFAVDVSESQVLAVRYPDSDPEEFIELDPGIDCLFENDELDYSNTTISSTPKTPSTVSDSDSSSRHSSDGEFSADDEMEKTQRFEKRKKKKKIVVPKRSSDSKEDCSNKRRGETSERSENENTVISASDDIKTRLSGTVKSQPTTYHLRTGFCFPCLLR